MNNIVANFPQTLIFAQEYGLPLNKKRAILREFLQIRILDLIYQQKQSNALSFVGGTSLRLLNNLDRFSEDLDFDNLGLNIKEIINLVNQVHSKLVKENIAVDLYQNTKNKKSYFEFRFQELLFQLKISTNPREKLTIRLDYSNLWQKQKPQTILFNRYGYIFNIITNPIDQILVQKMQAYLGRQETQARDIYDIIWLMAHGAKLDKLFIKNNKLSKNLTQLAKNKFMHEQKRIKTYQQRLKPFLINEVNAQKIAFFLQIFVE